MIRHAASLRGEGPREEARALLSVHNTKLPLPAVAATTTYRVVGRWLVSMLGAICFFSSPMLEIRLCRSFCPSFFLMEERRGASTESVSRPQKEAAPAPRPARPGLGATAGGSVPIVGVCSESARGVSLHCPRVQWALPNYEFPTQNRGDKKESWTGLEKRGLARAAEQLARHAGNTKQLAASVAGVVAGKERWRVAAPPRL